MDFGIIAAGNGSRLADEGVTTPKPLVRIGGEPLIDRLMRIFVSNGASSVSVIINEDMEDLYEHLITVKVPVPLHLLIRSTPGSMHSFFHLSKYIRSDRFCITTVDTVFKESEFSACLRAFREGDDDGLMGVTGYIDDEKPLYVNVDKDFSIRSFTDEAPEGCDGVRYVSGGIYCLQRPAIKVLRDAVSGVVTRMRDYQRLLIGSGYRLRAYPFGKIIDVDHVSDIEKAERLANGE
ncbi:MAG: NTP transferase domain-containing protein [Tannerellaceae bacterium]|jgi:NDP-sugar pyrophosphorylase family protein|nr:NTP transferase domain-containing protein [Tannerellaceae bacterium]